MDLDSRSGRLRKFDGDFLVQSYICGKIFAKIRSVFPEIRAKLWKNAPSCNVEECFEKFLDPDLEADDFQNFTSSSLSIENICGCNVLKLCAKFERNNGKRL